MPCYVDVKHKYLCTMPPPSGFVDRYSTWFEGTNEYIKHGNVLGFATGDPRSVSFWIKRVGGSGGYVMAKANGTVVGWGVGATVFPEFRLLNALNLMRVVSSIAINDGAWHHVGESYDGSGVCAGVEIYVDGVHDLAAACTNDTLGGRVTTNLAEFNISGRTNGSTLLDNADLDEVAVYDRVLTEAEFVEIYNGGTPNDLTTLATEPNLVLYIRMGDPPDTHLLYVDRSASGFDGTGVNLVAGDIVADAP